MPHTLLIETPAQTKSVTPCATLVSYSIPCPHVSLSDFLKYAAGGPRIYWESDNLPVCFVGSGIAAALIANGHHRFHTIQQQADQLFKQVVLLDRNTPTEAGP